ncbi:MAG TPA: lipid kinase [Chthonomonadaceae bacterium]|nr:lipid kinase [Chthonomonadaceae bacterium]
MSVTRQAVLIVNTRSRRGKEWFPRVKETLEQGGVDLIGVWALRRSQDAIARVQAATAQCVPLVIVGGGDGTLSSVVKHFVGSPSVLGVLPLGTGNQFARDLGIEAKVEAACRVLIEGKMAQVDLGIAGNDYFLNVATVGLTTRIAEELTVQAKRRFGRFVYAVALAHALRRVRPFQATLTLPERRLTVQTLQIVIGNGRFHAGPFPLAPDATITDGKLVAYVLATTSRWGLLKYALNLPGGHHVDLSEVAAFETTEIALETIPSERVTVDGEIPFRTPIRFGIAPRALRVMVPQEFAG